MNEERQKLLRMNLQISSEICASQTQNPQLRHLESIKELWRGQEKLLFSEEIDDGAQPTMQELLSDLKVIAQTSSHVGYFIRNLRANISSFDPSEYAGKLVMFLEEDGEMNWSKLTEEALPVINRAPGIDVLSGFFKASREEVKTLEKKRNISPKTKDKISEKQTAENISQIAQNQDSVDAKVTFVLEVLKRSYKRNNNNPIEFYRFVLHPTDFTATIENIFYISFIIRDGLASLDIFDEEMVISPLKEEKEHASQKMEKKQMVFSITISQWQALVAENQISEPTINWNNS